MKVKTLLLLLFISLSHLSGCREDSDISEENEEDMEDVLLDRSDYTSWTDETHGNDVDPNYDVVFNQENVMRLDITINSDDWSDMQSDLASNLGSFGGRPGQVSSDSDFDPIWVPCNLKVNDTEWYQVGIRYKGNSSLKSAYQSGNKKLSFKLDFDEFEDDYPALKNQRFYGFKQLNLNNNYNDVSLMREKVAADLFREFGLVSSQTRFCVLYINSGSGSQYYGVYAMVEEVDDTVLEDQLGDDSGNLYKPDGDAATFSRGSYDEDEMEKKNNEDLADYSDVNNLYEVLNSSIRTTDEEAWKDSLESVFNVNIFLKWLAANTVIQNWDTYGVMTHNFFLYNNHQDSLLMWIPWDNNESLQAGKQGGALSLSLDEVGDLWPLIRYLIDVDEYNLMYKQHMQDFVDQVFVPEKMIETYTTYYNLIKDYAYAEQSGYSFLRSDSEFDNGVEALKTHVQSRNNLVEAFLN